MSQSARLKAVPFPVFAEHAADRPVDERLFRACLSAVEGPRWPEVEQMGCKNYCSGDRPDVSFSPKVVCFSRCSLRAAVKAVLLPAFLVLATAILPGQNEKPPEVTLKAHARLVLAPVVVADKAGNHVAGLSKNDFELVEDGRPKSIASLEEIKTVAGRIGRITPSQGTYSNAIESDANPKRLTIFVLDMVNTPFLDQTYAREQLIKFLASHVGEQQPTALMAIKMGGIQVIHDFTSDPAALVAALKRVSSVIPEFRSPSPNDAGADVNAASSQLYATSLGNQGFNPDAISGDSLALLRFINGTGEWQVQMAQETDTILATLHAFQHLAEAFAGIPGRKSLIWATASFPFSLEPVSGRILSPTVYNQGSVPMAGFGDRRDRSGKLPTLPSVSEIRSADDLKYLEPHYQRTLQMLSDANIAVYPVDARGLLVFFPGADVSRIEGLGSYNAAIFEADRQTMLDFAQMTGGKAFYNRNDLDVAFQKAADDSASYYMLSYYLDNSVKPGWHKLRIKLKNHSGLQVRAREGFFVTPENKQDENRRMDLNLALSSPLDFTGVPMRVQWAGSQADGPKRRIRFRIELPADANLVDVAQNGLVNLEVIAVARTAQGASADESGQHVQVNLVGDTLRGAKSKGLSFTNDLILPPGEYSVRFVVRDNLSARLGSLTVPLVAKP